MALPDFCMDVIDDAGVSGLQVLCRTDRLPRFDFCARSYAWFYIEYSGFMTVIGSDDDSRKFAITIGIHIGSNYRPRNWADDLIPRIYCEVRALMNMSSAVSFLSTDAVMSISPLVRAADGSCVCRRKSLNSRCGAVVFGDRHGLALRLCS